MIEVLLAGSADDRELELFRRESRVLAKLASEHAAGTEPDGPVAPASAEPSATEAPEVPSAEPPAPAPVEAAAKPTHRTRRASAPRPPPPAPKTGGGPKGTLLAVAVGRSCAFQANGASKGTASSLRLSLKPGTYSVVCRPATGATKSKSVTVRSGETAMAAFKL